MFKKFLLLAGAAIALMTAGSSVIPAPPCTPDCNGFIGSVR
jgi:hypothetical protein